jgi:hypothetical protein
MKKQRHGHVLALIVALLVAGHLLAGHRAWNVHWTTFAAVGIVVVLVKIGIAGWLHAHGSGRRTHDDNAAP